MATVTVTRDSTRNAGGSRMLIRTKNSNIIFRSEIAPREVTYSGHENAYSEVTRPDRKPLLVKSGAGLRRISMEIFLGGTDPDRSFNDKLKQLEQLARANQPLIIEYEPRTYGEWNITSMSYDSAQRNKDSDEITRAIVSIEFTEYSKSGKW